MQPVRYFDGTTMAGRLLGASLEAGQLLLRADNGTLVALYAVTDLTVHHRDTRADRVDLGVSDRRDVRIIFEGQDAARFLADILPGLANRQLKAERKAGRKVAYMLAGLMALIGLVGWQLDRIVPPLIPASAERALGRDLVATQLEFWDGRCTAPAGQAALRKLRQRLSAGWPENRPISLYVANSPVVNAFTLPGGQIVLFRGLINAASGPDEVAGVLAHEMGHDRYRHPMRGLVRAMGFQVLGMLVSGGTAVDAGRELVASSYSRDMEAEADAAALALLSDAGISADPLADFFDRLAKKDRSPAALRDVANLFASHPASAERAALIRARAAGHEGTPALDADDWADLKAICSSVDKKQARP